MLKFFIGRTLIHKEESQQELNEPIITDNKIIRAISYLWGWDYLSSAWNKLITDTEGRLLVSTEATKTSNVTAATVTVDTSGEILSDERLDRKEIIIQNTGDEDIYLYFDSTYPADENMLILPSQSLFLNTYVGGLWAKTLANTSAVKVIEFHS